MNLENLSYLEVAALIMLLLVVALAVFFYNGQKQKRKAQQQQNRSDWLKYNPETGELLTETISADQWRERRPHYLWQFNPWTGAERPHDEMPRDIMGLKLLPANKS